MKTIKPTANKARWPRKAVKSIEARKRDLIIRIADWSRDRDEPAFDVEVYIDRRNFACCLGAVFVKRASLRLVPVVTSHKTKLQNYYENQNRDSETTP